MKALSTQEKATLRALMALKRKVVKKHTKKRSNDRSLIATKLEGLGNSISPKSGVEKTIKLAGNIIRRRVEGGKTACNTYEIHEHILVKLLEGVS